MSKNALAMSDDLYNRRMMRSILCGQGFNPLCSNMLPNARYDILKYGVDLIVVDIGLQILPALQMCQALLDHPDFDLRHVPIVIYSPRGFNDAEHAKIHKLRLHRWHHLNRASFEGVLKKVFPPKPALSAVIENRQPILV